MEVDQAAHFPYVFLKRKKYVKYVHEYNVNSPRFASNLKRMLPTTSDGGRDCCTDCGTRNGDRNVKNDFTEEAASAVVEEGEDGFSFT